MKACSIDQRRLPRLQQLGVLVGVQHHVDRGVAHGVRWRVATHAVGDAAIDLVLNAYEKANAERSIVDRRWSIEHAFIGRPDHLPRMKALGLAIAAQNHLYLAGPSLVKYWGATRAGITTPVKMYLDAQSAGVIGNRRAGRAVPAAVDALSLRHARHDHRRRARRRSTRAAPAGAAHGDDQQRLADDGRADKGSIEPGKFADLVILSEDPLTCPEPRLRDAEVLRRSSAAGRARSPEVARLSLSMISITPTP